ISSGSTTAGFQSQRASLPMHPVPLVTARRRRKTNMIHNCRYLFPLESTRPKTKKRPILLEVSLARIRLRLAWMSQFLLEWLTREGRRRLCALVLLCAPESATSVLRMLFPEQRHHLQQRLTSHGTHKWKICLLARLGARLVTIIQGILAFHPTHKTRSCSSSEPGEATVTVSSIRLARR
ncbi:hypothetical protein EV177_010613, partial [Coemansia sp. RSA 1804]